MFSGCLMHNAPSMVKSQLKTDKKAHTPIIEKIEAYKDENGQYPSSLSDLSLDERWRTKIAKYERYPYVDKSGELDDHFLYRIQTAWRNHGGHCLFESHPNKWKCDDFPIELNNSGNVHTIELKRLDKTN